MVTLLYGDEPQLLEEKKQNLLHQYTDRTLLTLREEQGPGSILGQLQEVSLFGEPRVFLLVHLPIFDKPKKKLAPEWQGLRDYLQSYTGEDPIILVYPETIDGRLQGNKAFLGAVESFKFEKVEGEALFQWIQQHCKAHKQKIDLDGMAYLRDLVDLWKDVPLAFLRTEFDRLFLLLNKGESITALFLKEHMTDFGEKNIFRFKDALLAKDARTLLDLFPSMLKNKSVDMAMAYVHNQMHLQLMVSECAYYGMTLPEIQSLFKEKGMKANPYTIKLAYEARRKIQIPAVAALISQLYHLILQSRQGIADMSQFQDICLAYCAN